jgi:nitrogen fixation protein FixH
MRRQSQLGFISLSAVILLFGLSACSQQSASSNTVIASQRAGDLTVTLANPKGRLSEGDNEFTVEFKNASGAYVDVGAITLTFDMPAMGSMPAMLSTATLTTTPTPGIYRARANLEMNGTWQVTVTYKGPAGEGQAKFSINAK